MPTHQTRATVGGDGSLTVRDLPFPAGTEVVVTVGAPEPEPTSPDALRGSVLFYADPCEPAVPEGDWDAAS